MTTVRWRQAVDGIPAADSELRVNVTRDGRVLSVLGAPAARPRRRHDAGADRGRGGARGPGRRRRVYRSLPRDRGPAGATRATRYADGTTAALALFAGRLAWRVTYRAASDAVYDVHGRCRRAARSCGARTSSSPTRPRKVWENYPGAASGGTATTVDLSPVADEHDAAGRPERARVLGPQRQRQRATTGEEVAPGQLRPFVPLSSGSGCTAAKPCSWNRARRHSWTTNRLQNAVQAFYLANRFHDHLAAAPISFTDRSFEGVDRLMLETDDGASIGSTTVNNANMYTPPDGTSPQMQMYLWSGPTLPGDERRRRRVDPLPRVHARALEPAGHATRDGAGALNSPQAGAMGEGWSDWYAKDFLVSQFPALDTAPRGEVHMGVYTDCHRELDPQRRASTARSALGAGLPGAGSAGSGGFTYGDFGQRRRRARGALRRRDLGADAVGPAHRRSARCEARRLVTQGDAAVAAGAVVPGHAQRDPARRRRCRAARRDLDGLRRARDGLLRHHDRRGRHVADRGLLDAAGIRPSRAARSPAA